MVFIGGTSRWRLLMWILVSILLYGAEAWAGYVRRKTYRQRMISVLKSKEHRIASGYKGLGFWSCPKWSLSTGRWINMRRKELGSENARREARGYILTEWQRRSQQSTKGKCSPHPEFTRRQQRRHGEVDYFLNQLLTRYDLFTA